MQGEVIKVFDTVQGRISPFRKMLLKVNNQEAENVFVPRIYEISARNEKIEALTGKQGRKVRCKVDIVTIERADFGFRTLLALNKIEEI